MTGKGQAHRPYEFGVKVSVAATLKRCKGGQFVTHVKAPPGNPNNGHTLETVIPDMQGLVDRHPKLFDSEPGAGGIHKVVDDSAT